MKKLLGLLLLTVFFSQGQSTVTDSTIHKWVINGKIYDLSTLFVGDGISQLNQNKINNANKFETIWKTADGVLAADDFVLTGSGFEGTRSSYGAMDGGDWTMTATDAFIATRTDEPFVARAYRSSTIRTQLEAGSTYLFEDTAGDTGDIWSVTADNCTATIEGLSILTDCGTLTTSAPADAITALDLLVLDVNAENEADLASVATTVNDGSSAIDLTFSTANATVSTVAGFKQFDMATGAYGQLVGSNNDDDFDEDSTTDFSIGIVINGSSNSVQFIGRTHTTSSIAGYGMRPITGSSMRNHVGGVQNTAQTISYTGRTVLIMTYDASENNMRLYVDGVLVDTTLGGSTYAANIPFTIFARSDGSEANTGAWLRAFKTNDLITLSEAQAITTMFD